MLDTEIFEHLSEIVECDAFELYEDEVHGDYYIPYMMNDALEYYLILKDARMMGSYVPDIPIESVKYVKESEGYVLIIRQEDSQVCTIRFHGIEEKVQGYQYHSIGHFWRKGAEQWRQLVYIIGTIYDKYEYFGHRFCNDEELEIMNLICFAPFRYWSPIRDSLDELYSDHIEGWETMDRIVRESGDREYLFLMRLYKLFPLQSLKKMLAEKLLSPKRQKLYDRIYEKVREASLKYPVRDYGSEINEKIEAQRILVENYLKEHGYQGKYPVFEKSNIQAIITEEHPFTIMENKDYHFKIQVMLSKCSKRISGRNAGFFKGQGCAGEILDWEKFMQIDIK